MPHPGPDSAASITAAAETVATSPIFDHEWVSAQTGHAYADRLAAARDYVSRAATEDLSPHPLFEPTWVYPGGRWRDKAPDPLSFYLSRPERTRGTHPLLGTISAQWWESLTDQTELPWRFGDKVTLADVRHAVAHGRPVDAPDVSLVLPHRDFARLLPWLRQAYRISATVEILVMTDDPVLARLARGTGAAIPGVRIVDSLAAASAAITVLVEPDVETPLWPWLDLLLPKVGPTTSTTALLLTPAGDVVAAGAVLHSQAELNAQSGPTQRAVRANSTWGPLLAGTTPDDVARMAHLPVEAAWPGVVAVDTAAARRAGLDTEVSTGGQISELTAAIGQTYVVPEARATVPDPRSRVPGSHQLATTHPLSLLAAAGFESPGHPLRIREGLPARRWALDIAAPAAPRGRRWGDDVFARSLKDALERAGQWVSIDHPETRARASRDLDDIVLVIRGLEAVPVAPRDNQVHALWVISHPADVTAEECRPYDRRFAAGPAWARDRTSRWRLPIEPLLQCTDPRLFYPGVGQPDTGPEFLFVGNSRATMRDSVRLARELDLPLTVYGDGWSDLLPPGAVSGVHVPADRLGAAYARAGAVLNDHWPDMRELGFVSNRTFDVLAAAGRLICDDVAGLHELFGDTIAVWRDADDFARITSGDWRARFGTDEQRRTLAHRVITEHSFDARARQLIDALVPLTTAIPAVRP
ncbi:MAG: glycosyltransferase [Nocardioides sp.]